MNKLLTIIALALMAAPASADVIDTFRSACLRHLGDPTAIVKRGTELGFDMNSLGGYSWIGFNKGNRPIPANKCLHRSRF